MNTSCWLKSAIPFRPFSSFNYKLLFNKSTHGIPGLLLVLGILATRPVFAASETWVGASGTTGNWSDINNWSGVAAPGSTTVKNNTDIATFNAADTGTWGDSAVNPIVIDQATQNIKGISFDTNAGAYFIGSTGGNSLFLTSGGTIQILSTFAGSGITETINAPLVLEGGYNFTNANADASNVLDFGGGISTAITSGTATLVLNGANSGMNTISGVISNGTSGGAVAVETNNATANWVLSGNNTYSGLTDVNAGTLVLTGNNSGASGGITDNRGTLDINSSTALGTGTLSLLNASALDNTSGAAITDTLNNAINVGSASFTFDGSNNLNLGTGPVILGPSSHGTWTVTANTLTLGGNISGGSIVYKGGAGTLVLSGTNSGFTGGLDLGPNTSTAAGTLDINSATALGTGPFAIEGTGNSAIDNTSGGPLTLTTNNTQTWAASFTYNGTYNLNLGTGAVTLTNTPVITLTAGVLTEGGVISGIGKGITTTGAGTLALTAANTYTGATTLSGGTLDLQNSLALQDSTVSVGAGSIAFDSLAASTSFTFGALSGAGNLPLQNNAVSPAAVALTVGNNNANATYSGALSAAGSLTVIGTGTLTLSGNNTYSGATDVTGGGLIVSGSLTGSSSTSVTNATLQGTGSITGPVTIGNGLGGASTAVIAVGLTGTTGAFSTGALTLNSDAVYKFKLNPTLGTSDQLDVTGSIALGNGVATLSGSVLTDKILTGGQVFDIASFTGGISGYFAGLPDGSAYLLGDNSYIINYGTAVPDEITLTAPLAVPEAQTWITMLGGLGMLLGFQRMRRHSHRT